MNFAPKPNKSPTADDKQTELHRGLLELPFTPPDAPLSTGSITPTAPMSSRHKIAPDDSSNRGMHHNHQPTSAPPQSIAAVGANPYDPNGDGPIAIYGLAANYVDLKSPNNIRIRRSPCKRMFESFSQCHNAVLHHVFKLKHKPMFFQCQGQYNRFLLCAQKNDLYDAVENMIEDPQHSNIVYPDGTDGNDYRNAEWEKLEAQRAQQEAFDKAREARKQKLREQQQQQQQQHLDGDDGQSVSIGSATMRPDATARGTSLSPQPSSSQRTSQQYASYRQPEQQQQHRQFTDDHDDFQEPHIPPQQHQQPYNQHGQQQPRSIRLHQDNYHDMRQERQQRGHSSSRLNQHGMNSLQQNQRDY